MGSLRGVRVAVLGDGIVGLNTALELARRGAEVKVYTETESSSMAPSAASDKACAMWLPVLLDDPRLDRWCSVSYSNFQELASQGGWFVSSLISIEMIDEQEELLHPPAFIRGLPEFRIESGSINGLAVPPAGAWLFRNFVISIPQHLAKLKTRARAQGCVVVTTKFESLDHMLATVEEKVIFNCLGLGSKVVFGDDKFEPVKGHLVFFDPVSLDYSVGRGQFVIIPRPDALVAGVLYRDTFDVLHPVASDRDEILNEVRTWIDADIYGIGLRNLDLADGRIRYESTGLRPVRRDGVRLESELLDDDGRLIVHDYGHGGSGITIAYGCAVEAVNLAAEYL